VSVDDNMKKQWEAAKDEKEMTKALAITSKRALDDLSRVMNDAMDELARLAEDYACLSLSGSFLAPLEKAIRLLEQRCKGMEEKGVSPEQLERMHGSVEQMKGKLNLLIKAKEKAAVTAAKEVWEKVTDPVQEGARKIFGKVKEAGIRMAEVRETELELAWNPWNLA
jgi:chaperonin cofactor prefoldin